MVNALQIIALMEELLSAAIPDTDAVLLAAIARMDTAACQTIASRNQSQLLLFQTELLLTLLNWLVTGEWKMGQEVL